MWTFYTFHAYNIVENWTLRVIAQSFESDWGPFALACDFLNMCLCVKICSKRGPFSFSMDFLYMPCVHYWGKLDLRSPIAKFWTRLWTSCICMGLFRGAYATISSKIGPFSFIVDFLCISCLQYWGKMDLWSHSAKFWTRLCGPFALAWDLLNVRTRG